MIAIIIYLFTIQGLKRKPQGACTPLDPWVRINISFTQDTSSHRIERRFWPYKKHKSGASHQQKRGIGWFQKISIPIPRAASRNSEGEGGLRRLEFRGHGGVTSTVIPRTWGGFIGLEFRRHTGVFRRVTSSLV